jgi:hypothetical protein
MAAGAVTGDRERTVIDENFDVEPHAPLFFVSYARTRAADLILEFFRDLSNHVQELVGRTAGADPGFLDRSMAGGQRWAPEVLRAVGTCQVFVPLISPSLFESKWCAYEWDAFSQRKVLNRATRAPDLETAILPVIWSLPDSTQEPTVVRWIQRFSPSGLPDSTVASLYEREGIYGLRSLNMDSAYRAVVWRLAQRIAGLYRSHFVTPMTFADIGQLRNVFTEEGG